MNILIVYSTLLGVLAVLAVTVGNSVITIYYLRRVRVRTILAGLYGEIRVLRGEAIILADALAEKCRQGSLEWSASYDSQLFDSHRLSEPLVYRALASQIGLLRPDAAERIAYFYAQLENSRSRIVEWRLDGTFSINRLFLLLHALCTAKNHIVPLVRQIERNLGRSGSDSSTVSVADEVLEEIEFKVLKIYDFPHWTDDRQ